MIKVLFSTHYRKITLCSNGFLISIALFISTVIYPFKLSTNYVDGSIGKTTVNQSIIFVTQMIKPQRYIISL